MVTGNQTSPKVPLSSPDPAVLTDAIATKFRPGLGLKTITPLAGDASNRRYFRATLTGGPPHSAIVMQLAEPEGFKQSEEAVSGAAHQIAELPFINIRSHLAGVQVPVPTLYYYDQPAGLLYLEDFGDVTLADAVSRADQVQVASYYRQAIDVLVQMQVHATKPEDHTCLAFHRGFDAPLLMWEFEHFLEYGVEVRNGKPLAATDAEAIRRVFQTIADQLVSQPRIFTHRDYHSRNLMVNGTGLGVIDFQDALMGPVTYDLASLVRDAYIKLDEALVDELVGYYQDHMIDQGADCIDRATFRRLFDLTSIQRNLKAAGRFVYIDRVKGNPKFLADIPRVLSYVKRNLGKYPELEPLRKHLAPYVPELQ